MRMKISSSVSASRFAPGGYHFPAPGAFPLAVCLQQPINDAINAYARVSELDLNNDIGLENSDRVIQSGKLSIALPQGTVLRFADFTPGSTGFMHRTANNSGIMQVRPSGLVLFCWTFNQ